MYSCRSFLRQLDSSLIQFAAILLTVHSYLDSDTVIRSSNRRIRKIFLLAESVQSLILDDCGKILVADIQIHIAVDACNLALAAVLPDGIGTAVVGLIDPVGKPNGVAALDIIGSVGSEG